MSIVGTLSAQNGNLTSTLTDSDLLNPTRTGSFSDDYLLEELTFGQIITIELTSDEIDTYLQLIDADTGEVIAEDDDSGTGVNSRLRFTAIEEISYIVRVTSYGSRDVGTYQLSAVSNLPPVVVGTISATNGTVAGNLSTEDSFNPNRTQNYYVDEYQLTEVTAGEVVTLNLDSTDFNTYIQLIDADTGKKIKDDYSSGEGTNSELKFVAVEGVNYRVRVSSSREESIGTYQLRSISTAMDLADLTVINNTAPNVIALGEEAEVTWTVANIGDADATTSRRDYVYLSRDTVFDPERDANLGSVYSSDFITVGNNQTLSSNIAIGSYDLERANGINNNPLEGDWYLLFVSDANDNQLESSESNNVAVHQLELNATDIAITNVEAPQNASIDETISLSWTVENIGDVSAFGYWGDEIYLSDDEYFDYNDDYLEYGEREDYTVALASGDSYTISLETTIGNTKTGSRYLLFKTDTYNDLGETDETNNIIAVPIEINGVDANLKIDATGPITAALGENVAVSWTVNNTGSQTANANWQDRIYLSNDRYFDSDDTYLGYQYAGDNTPLASQDNYTVNRNITIPSSTEAGERYLLFVADYYDAQYETDGTDNVAAIPIEITRPDVDLVVTQTSVPSQVNAGNRVSVSWTVENTGTSSAGASYWYDQVYFSTDETYDSSDTQLRNYYIGGSTTPLAPGETYTKNYTFTVPNVEADNYYLLFQTDGYNYQIETDATNNITAVPIEVTQSPNLIIADVNAPDTGYIGDFISISWTVNNSGEGTALGSYWYDRVYLSTDENYDSTDTFIASHYTGSITPLAVADSYTANRNLAVPDVEAGDYYLLFYTDSSQNQGESDETDNIATVPIELLPSNLDLSVNDITAPDTANAGNQIALSSTVLNNGSTPISGGYWYDRVYFSTDEIYDSTDTVLTSSYIGGSTASLAPGETYSRNSYFTLPDVEVGNYYLIFSADGSDRLKETDETNNITTVPIEIAESPNLTVSDVVVPDSANASERINVSWTISNIGDGEALGDYWYDRIYFSTDEIYDENDTQLAYNYYSPQNSLASEESYTSSRNITLPDIELGNYYLLFYTDKNQIQGESDETDNVRAVPIELTSVNLTVSDTASPSEAVVNDTVDVSWTVTNEGNGVTSAHRWDDYVYLSSDENYDENDTQLISKITEETYPDIEPGNSYTASSSISLPNVEAGDYYLIFYTNNSPSSYSRQGESDRSDNFTAVPISLSSPDVDLSITVNSSPTSALVQGGANLSWTVTNNGTDAALADYWYDYIYVSDDEVYDENDSRVDYFYQNNTPLAAGESYTKNLSVTIPNTHSGERYLLFVADGQDRQSETDLTNNTVAVPIDIKAPNLTISNVVAPSKANKNSSDVAVSWEVTNTGDVTTLANYWYDSVYFSTDNQYDSSDSRLTYVRKENDYTGYYNWSNRRIRAGESYSRTSKIDVPDADPGNYYLIFVADSSNQQGETDEADNVRVIPFELLDTTNIKPIDATAPLQATLNDTVDVSWTVTNTGSATASATWYDWIYISEDEILDNSDIYVTRQKQDNNTFIASGDSYTATSNVTIPKAAGIGSRYVLFVTDRNDYFPETDETDNVLAVPIKLNATNLKVTGADVPSVVSFNETVDVSWTVANTGNDRAGANWTDYIYLSNDAVYDDNDTYLNRLESTEFTPLEAGDAYTASQSVVIPRTVDLGSQYILFVTDRQDRQGETDETDNTLAVPLEVQSPDLEIAEVAVPTDASLNQTLSLSWTVTNTGEGTAFPDSYYSSWRDYVFLSDDAIHDETDIPLTNRTINDSLESGHSYTFNADVRLSDDRIGSYYILFVSDRQNVEKESDETNNVYAAPINIQTANLEISEVNSPAQAFLNQQISLSWTVINTGTGDAFAPRTNRSAYNYNNPWWDRVYLSEDEIIDENDKILTNYNENKLSLASGNSYTFSRNVYIPSTAAGDYYLLFATDAYQALVESDENDNVHVKPITIGATNLEVTNVNAPTDLILNQTIATSWTVSNTGNVTAPSEWYDYVYISDDRYLDDSDIALDYQRTDDRTPLAAGDSYTVNKNLVIPHTTTGDRYLLFVTDRNNVQGETDETDNIYALPVNIAAPNLTVTNTDAPQSSYLGETVEISWTVANQGDVEAPKSGYDHIYISDDQYLDESDVSLFAQTTSDRTSLDSNNSYTISEDVTIPRTVIGDRYLLFVTDRNNLQGETDETDNIVAVPIELTALDVDLVVSNIDAPIESYAGEEVEVVWTVTNNGSDDATGTWTDRIYLAKDPENIQANEIYGTFNFTGTVAGGESIERRQKITLPQTLEGDFSIIVKTDIYDNLIEYGAEGNNTTVRPEQFSSILPTFPNLQVKSVTAPSTAFSSQSTVVEWTVTNTGDAATSAPFWQDSVWLSLDQNFDGADLKLGQASNPSYLNPGESYSNSLEVTLPQGIDGNYYFLVKTDDDRNRVFEFQNENDNFGVSNVSDIELTPPPDLQVSVNAPSNAFSSQYTSLSWTVTNEGTGRTLQSSWYDEVYLSTDTVLDGSDEYLGRQSHYGVLEPGESYTVNEVNRLFKLPEGISGDYYFIVRTDAGNQVYESALSANNTSFDETATTVFLTPPPDLEITVDAPKTAIASKDVTLNFSTDNYGATATSTGSWLNSFYLSTDNQFDSSDIFLGSRRYYEAFGTYDYSDKSIVVTLPDGVSGDYYIFAQADSENRVFELDKDNNIAFDTITIDSQPADLAISEVIATEVIEAGKGAKVSWTVTNQGIGDTVKTNWNDQLWLSVDSIIGNGNDYLLGTFASNGLLKPGESYTREELITVPFDLQGNYQLYIKTDVNNSVYEASNEDNNTSVFSPIAITRETPDLQVTNVTAATNGASGDALAVEWSVANLGTGKTNSNYWYDEVFLSKDSDLGDSSDISLGKVYRSGSLDSNEDYQVARSFRLPEDLDGDYYVIVRTDVENRVLETPLENNNETAASNSTSIALNTVPDLVINEIDAPLQAISGQTFDVSWTVSNQGANTNSSWREVFYLSRDQVFDRSSDIYLGSSFNFGNLVTGGEYSKTASFEIPQGLSGSFYVFGVTDSSDSIYERFGENNNIAYDGNSMNVILPPPADLGDGSINIISDAATSGDFVSLDYTVQSLGANLPLGTWTDSIYLSEDEQWDINDLLLTKVKTSAFSIRDGSYTRNINVQLPGVTSGDYHLIVRSDILNEISESNEDNNISVSAETINIDIPLIEIGTPINGTLNRGQEVYYRVDVPSGETLQFVLDSLSDNAVNELYVSYGKMPTRADFDFGFEEIAADQDIVVPLSEAGTYYILARGQYVPKSTQDYSVSVNTIDFGITDTETTVGDKGGSITFAIEGAKFGRNLTAALENEAGEVIESTNIWYEDSTKVFATFDLTEATIGDYNLKVSQPSISSDLVENEAGEIVPVLRETTIESVVENGFEVIAPQLDDLLVTVDSTARVRPGQYFDVVLTYANNGTHDIEAPLLHLEADQNIGFTNIQDGDEFVGNNSMTLLGISNEGAAGILRPGEIGTVRLRARANGAGTINITASKVQDDGTSLDYEQFINYIGGDLADPAWANAADALEEQFGTSWSSFASGLASIATERSTLGEYSHSISELWTDVALDAWGDGVDSNDISEVESISNLASSSLAQENVENISNTLDVQSQSELIEPKTLSSAMLAPSTIESSTFSESSYFVDELLDESTINPEGDGVNDNNISEVEENNLVQEDVVEPDFDSDEANSEPESESIEDTLNAPDVQSHLRSAEQIILDGAAVIRNEYGADKAAAALEKFVGRLGLENPPSENYEELQEDLDEIDVEDKVIFDDLKTYIESQINDEWQIRLATVQDVTSVVPFTDVTSSYEHDIPYETTFHDNGSVISNAIKNSSTYQSKVINNSSIKNYIETQIEENQYQGNNDLSSNPIYVNNENLAGVFGNSNDFNYFDQTKLVKATADVIRNWLQISSLAGTDFGPEVAQQYRDNLDASVRELEDLHNQYFGNAASAELAFLMGRTPTETRQARVNSINIEEADCDSPQLAYTAEINFFILDGTTFGADDAYKDELVQWASLSQTGLALGLLNFLIDPFSGEDSLGRENINNLLKVGPALGLGWDVQQFGYGQPHFNLVKVEDTIEGFIPNPNYDPNCDDDDDVPSNPPTSPLLDETKTDVPASHDPNDILGPEGFGEEKWIDAEEPLDYTIRFENDPELASAPAQVVRITQQLDEDLDFRTFRLGDFGFGDTFIDVPDNRAFYQTRLDLVEEKGIYVDVFAGIDIATGEAFWELRSIDPETGEQPNDPLLGFLPPNLTKPEGDGFVNYSIRADRDIETGAVIDAEATIIFDINEPIDTPPIFNTIDVGKPDSTINALPELSDSEEFTVSWSGSDDPDGSAIADYTIYVSENGSEFTPWLENTTLTEAVFTGTPGNSYEFYAVARDNAGNVQDIPTAAQASTAIAGDNNPPVLLKPIGTQVVAEDSSFSLTISGDTFTDSDEGDVLTYSATLADGSELPNWLTFDAETKTFSGIPTNEDLGNLNILVTVSDFEGETVSDILELIVENVNDAPTVQSAVANQTANEDEEFIFSFPEDTFSDVDAGDSLTYSATLADGSELSSWLSFNADTRSFSGTPVNEDVGTLSILVSATDNDGEAATDIFDLEVINFNDVPSDIELSSITIDENSSNGTVIGNLSTLDPDVGDTFSYTLLNDASGRFILDGNELQVASGNLLDFEANSSHSIEIQTTDTDGLSIAKNFTISLNNINEAPAIANDSVTANSSSPEVIAIDYLLENDSDPESDSLILTAVDNAAGGTVSIDGDNVIFTPDGNSSTGGFEYTVSDGEFTNTATVTINIGVTENGSNSSDTINGTSGDDSYRGRNGNDSISGLAGDDSIKGEDGNDTLNGGIGNDTIDGGKHDDYLLGGAGIDYIIGGEGTDTLDGGEGGDFYLARHNNIDTYSDTGTDGVDVILASGQNNFNLELGLTFNANSGIEQIDGSAIANKFEIRASGSNQDNIWDFSELDLLGVDVINGRKGNDSIISSMGDDKVKGEDGNDTLNGGVGNDTLDGGKHNDFLLGSAGMDYLIGGEGLDTLDGGEDGDFYLARHNNIDTYSDSGTTGVDVIVAEGQNNFNLELGLTFNSDSGIEQIDGNRVSNKFEIRANGSNQGNTWDFSELDLLGVDVINGRKGNDFILGSTGDDSIKGEDGNDTLNGGVGSDTLDGGKHDDYLLGGMGVDYLIGGSGTDSLDGGESGDFYLARHNNIDVYSDSGTQGVDVILASGQNNFNLELGQNFNSDSGIEQIDGTAIANQFVIRANGSNEGNTWDFSDLDLLGVDVINGRKGNDSIIGSMDNDSIKGEDGNDTLNGGFGNDTLDGGKNDDYLLGGAGIDYIIGGEGTDSLDGGEDGDFYLARHNNIDVYSDTGTEGVDVILASGQNNFNLELGQNFNSDSGIEQIDGSGINNKFEIRANGSNQGNTWDFSDLDLLGVDVINGRKGNDSIIGSTGDDSIKGEDGNDTLNGGIGNDTLDGGKHDDYLSGGLGNDTLTGGNGKDSFFFNSLESGIDTITDFSVNDDRLVFSAAGFGGNLTAGMVSSEMFTVGTAATSEEHRFIYDAGSGDVFYDSDGAGDREQTLIARLNSGLSLGSNNLFINS